MDMMYRTSNVGHILSDKNDFSSRIIPFDQRISNPNIIHYLHQLE